MHSSISPQVKLTVVCKEHGHQRNKSCTHCLCVRNVEIMMTQLREKRAALVKELSAQLTQGHLIITGIE